MRCFGCICWCLYVVLMFVGYRFVCYVVNSVVSCVLVDFDVLGVDLLVCFLFGLMCVLVWMYGVWWFCCVCCAW